MPVSMADNSPWWPRGDLPGLSRSFADGDGDGIGDVAGIRSRLDHLAALGVDAIWFSPGTRRRWPTPATTCPTTVTSTRSSAPSPRWRR
ncbi:alpha-amylase family glycosyl hydrolase [Micromonospora sp. BRA006-A]|nr:alpha-amylase family glycosyl hydrolase [Micromonospora sp. BRA006-A]